MLCGYSYMILSTLVISFVFNIVYLFKKHINTVETKLFGYLIFTNFVSLVLEFLSSYMGFTYEIDAPITKSITKLFILSLVTFVFFMTLYGISICYISGKKQNIKMYNYLKNFFIIIYSLIAILIFVLPIECRRGYAVGPAVDASYYSIGLIIISWLVIFAKNWSNISKKKIIPLILFVLALIVTSLIQKANPSVTITTIASFLILFIMYHTIENPDLNMISKLELAKDQADKANKAKSEFLSSMSHEIRTPLNAIVGLSNDIIDEDKEASPRIREDAKDIVDASNTLLELVGNILDISKIESGKIDIVNTTYNFKEELENVCKINEYRIGDKPIDFILNIAEDIPYKLIGDKVHVKEVLNNLISNAIKYTDKGSITVTANCINHGDNSTIIVSVKDTGKGIKEENISKLFDRYERLDASKTTIEGTGLGLNITKNLVTLMNGTIEVKSKYQVGSEFIVKIPQKISEMNEPVEDKNISIKKTDKYNFGHKKILLVDDNKLNLKVAHKALEGYDFEIIDANDGENAINKWNETKDYDIILMDIMMPNMNGEEALKKLKSDSSFKTPVIALTADAINGAEEKYKEEGFADYISKPFNKEEISEKLARIFNG